VRKKDFEKYTKKKQFKQINEAKLKDIVPDIIYTAAQYTNKKLDHIARQSWDSSEELTKQIMQSIPMHKWASFRKDVNKLLKQHTVREELRVKRNHPQGMMNTQT
jgi:leucyl aminopeptidase (aminopeptidase T)